MFNFLFLKQDFQCEILARAFTKEVLSLGQSSVTAAAKEMAPFVVCVFNTVETVSALSSRLRLPFLKFVTESIAHSL